MGFTSSCTVYKSEFDEIDQCKDIYSKQIVYTTSFKAQSDYIYDEFMGDGRRAGRNLEDSLVIVDESDNMFIDKALQACVL